MIAGVVLAAGESRRMGFPKALLPYRDTTFLAHLVGVLDGQVDPLIVVSGAIPLAAKAQVIVNEGWQQGQLSSLKCAIRALPAGADALLVALVDHPCIDRELVTRMIAEFAARRPELLIPTYNGRRGHPMIFSRELFGELLDAPLDQGARTVVRRHDPMLLPVQTEGVLHDLDDPETYERVLGRSISSLPSP